MCHNDEMTLPAVQHVKEKWGKDLYLESMAFGRTTT